MPRNGLKIDESIAKELGRVNEMEGTGYDEYKDLKPLSFYWVRPAFDVDLDGEFEEVRKHWHNKEQPGLYLGNGKWALIGIDTDNGWPVIWVWEEICYENNEKN